MSTILQEEELQVNGIKLSVRRRGEGSPFFYTHGLLGSMELEDETGIIDWPLIEQVAHVIRYDVRGHGDSGVTLSPSDYRWESLVHDAKDIMDRLNFVSYVVGGQSMGAVISLFLALMIPEKIRKLVLVTPPALWEEGIRHGEIYEFAAALLEEEGMQRLLSLMKERQDLADRRLISDPEITNKFVQSLMKQDPRVISAILRGAAGTGFPPRDRLREVRVPTLILAWTDDVLHPVSSAEELAHLIPDSRLFIAQNDEDIVSWSRLVGNFLAPTGDD